MPKVSTYELEHMSEEERNFEKIRRKPSKEKGKSTKKEKRNKKEN